MPSKVKFPTISSFFVALSIYLSIVVVLFIKLTFFTEPAKKYTDDKDAFMDIIMDEREISEAVKAPKQADKIVKENKPEPKNEPKEEPKKETTNKPVPEESLPQPSIPAPPKEQPKPEPKPEIPTPSEKSEPVKEEPKPDLKNLFSNIDTTKLKKDNGIAKTQPKEQSRKKSESANSANSQEASDIIKSMQIDKVSKTPKSQMTGVYNETLGSIKKQVEIKWHSYKADTNNKAKVKVIIDTNGKFSYEILELSYDENFNNKLRECLERLTHENFAYSKNKDLEIDMDFVDKLE